MTVQLGSHVMYVDSERRDRPALVTKVQGCGDRPTLNLVFINDKGSVESATSVQPIVEVSGTPPTVELHKVTGKPVLDPETGKKKIKPGKPSERDAGNYWRA